MAIFLGLAMVAFLGVASVAVDVGYMYMARRQLQTAADAAALAGVRELANNSESGARTQAVRVATANELVGAPVPINPQQDVQFGRWSGTAFTLDGMPKNAMRVTLRKTEGTPQGPLALFFGQALGIANVDLTAAGTATLSALDVALVLDTSSSMVHDTVWKKCTKTISGMCGCGTPNSNGYQPFDTLRAAAKNFIDDFDPAFDKMAVATFATTAKTPLNQTLVTPFATAKAAITAIPTPDYCNGTRYTNIGDGIAKGIAELRSTRTRPGTAKIMVLLSDGDPTCNASGSSCGTTAAKTAGQAHARAQADAAAGYDIVIHAISLGDGADRDLMQDIAEKTGGEEYFAETAADLADVFEDVRTRIPVQLVH